MKNAKHFQNCFLKSKDRTIIPSLAARCMQYMCITAMFQIVGFAMVANLDRLKKKAALISAARKPPDAFMTHVFDFLRYKVYPRMFVAEKKSSTLPLARSWIQIIFVYPVLVRYLVFENSRTGKVRFRAASSKPAPKVPKATWKSAPSSSKTAQLAKSIFMKNAPTPSETGTVARKRVIPAKMTAWSNSAAPVKATALAMPTAPVNPLARGRMVPAKTTASPEIIAPVRTRVPAKTKAPAKPANRLITASGSAALQREADSSNDGSRGSHSVASAPAGFVYSPSPGLESDIRELVPLAREQVALAREQVTVTREQMALSRVMIPLLRKALPLLGEVFPRVKELDLTIENLHSGIAEQRKWSSYFLEVVSKGAYHAKNHPLPGSDTDEYSASDLESDDESCNKKRKAKTTKPKSPLQAPVTRKSPPRSAKEKSKNYSLEDSDFSDAMQPARAIVASRREFQDSDCDSAPSENSSGPNRGNQGKGENQDTNSEPSEHVAKRQKTGESDDHSEASQHSHVFRAAAVVPNQDNGDNHDPDVQILNQVPE